MEVVLKFLNSNDEILFTKRISKRNACDIHSFFCDKARKYLQQIIIDLRSEKKSHQETNKRLYPRSKNIVTEIGSNHFDDGVFYPKIAFKKFDLYIKFRENISQDNFLKLGYWDYVKNVLTGFGISDLIHETETNNI